MPMMSVEARGAISGVEFRQTHCGAVVGRKSTASYQSTPLQMKTRGRLIGAHRAWELLTDSQRSAWNAHATYPATGRNTYIAMWVRFSAIGKPKITIPLTPLPQNPLTNLRITTSLANPQEIDVEWDSPQPFYDLIAIYIYPTFSNRLNPTMSKLRFAACERAQELAIYAYTTINAPVYHVRLDMICSKTGDVRYKRLYRVLNPGW
jgi:hypothetical protein